MLLIGNEQIQQTVEKKITFLQSRGFEILSVKADLNQIKSKHCF